MITLHLLPTGLQLRRDDGYVCFARHGDDATLAGLIADLASGRQPRSYVMRPAAPPPYRPLFARNDAEDRRRVALAEERAALQAQRTQRQATPAQLGSRLAKARAKYF